MPNIITHTIFADEILDAMDDGVKEWLEPRKQLYEIGANGPDFLFFSGYPAKVPAGARLQKLGSIVHEKNVNGFYKKAVECIRNEKDEDIQKDMIAYVCGHLCHWALDSSAHPYVFYRTGCYTNESSFWHHRLESILDAIMLKVKREQTIVDFKAYEICDVSLEIVRAIARIYCPVAKDVFDTDIRPHEILDTLNDWYKCQKLLYDPNGKKYKTFEKMESAVRKKHAISGLFVPNTPDDPFDACNLLHKTWHHPCDYSIVSTESFFDIYDCALIEAKNVIRLFLSSVQDEKNVEDLMNFINDRNYDTGLNVEKEMLYFELIY